MADEETPTNFIQARDEAAERYKLDAQLLNDAVRKELKAVREELQDHAVRELVDQIVAGKVEPPQQSVQLPTSNVLGKWWEERRGRKQTKATWGTKRRL